MAINNTLQAFLDSLLEYRANDCPLGGYSKTVSTYWLDPDSGLC
jgi:hypothetical protein